MKICSQQLEQLKENRVNQHPLIHITQLAEYNCECLFLSLSAPLHSCTLTSELEKKYLIAWSRLWRYAFSITGFDYLFIQAS